MKTVNFSKILIILLFLLLPVNIFAQEVGIKEVNDLDLSIIINEEKDFGNPDKIIIIPLDINSENELNAEKWYRGLFYYTVDRLGFSDMPFHYIVSENGEVFEGNRSGDEKKINIKGIEGNPVVIGYLNNKGKDYFSAKSEKVIEDLVVTIANRNIIKPDTLSIVGAKFKKNNENKSVVIESHKLNDNWVKSIDKVSTAAKARYSPTQKEYKVEVLDINISKEEQTPGVELEGNLKLKNTGNYGLYVDSASELVLTKESSGTSKFYVNKSWLSQTQVGIMNESQILRPGKEDTYKFKIKAPLHKGEFSENFVLKTFAGGNIQSDKKIELKVKLKTTDKEIIEIKNNSIGFVNVRKDPNNSQVLRKVTPGERFFLLEVNNQTLWAKIDLGDGISGWIAVWQYTVI